MYDMLVSTPSCADQGVQDGTPPMGKEHQLIGSDHRAAVIHCDIYARPGLDSPTMPRDDVKLSIRKATSDLEKGEHSRIADALMREVEGFMAKSPTVVDHARDNSLDTRVRQMGVKYADAKKNGVDVQKATNDYSNALDKMMVETASRVTWSYHKPSQKGVSWSPAVSLDATTLNFLSQHKGATMETTREIWGALPEELQTLILEPWSL